VSCLAIFLIFNKKIKETELLLLRITEKYKHEHRGPQFGVYEMIYINYKCMYNSVQSEN